MPAGVALWAWRRRKRRGEERLPASHLLPDSNFATAYGASGTGAIRSPLKGAPPQAMLDSVSAETMRKRPASPRGPAAPDGGGAHGKRAASPRAGGVSASTALAASSAAVGDSGTADFVQPGAPRLASPAQTWLPVCCIGTPRR